MIIQMMVIITIILNKRILKYNNIINLIQNSNQNQNQIDYNNDLSISNVISSNQNNNENYFPMNLDNIDNYYNEISNNYSQIIISNI